MYETQLKQQENLIKLNKQFINKRNARAREREREREREHASGVNVNYNYNGHRNVNLQHDRDGQINIMHSAFAERARGEDHQLASFIGSSSFSPRVGNLKLGVVDSDDQDNKENVGARDKFNYDYKLHEKVNIYIDSLNGIQFWNNDEILLSRIPHRDVFLVFDLRLHDINIKKQTFTISGWMHVFWEWQPATKLENHYLSTLRKYQRNIIYDLDDYGGENDYEQNNLHNALEFVPINPLNIFDQSSTVDLKHTNPTSI